MLDKDIVLKLVKKHKRVNYVTHNLEDITKDALYNIAVEDILNDLENYFDGKLPELYIQRLQEKE